MSTVQRDIAADRCPYCARHLPGEAPEFWGPAEIRAYAGQQDRFDGKPVSSRTLHVWRQRPDFPAPIAELSIGPVWDAATVRAWHAQRRMLRET